MKGVEFSRKQFQVDQTIDSPRYGGEAAATGLSCKLCGKKIEVGDYARWIYANSTVGAGTGNFFVCSQCDDADDMVTIEKAKKSLAEAVRLAKQWGF